MSTDSAEMRRVIEHYVDIHNTGETSGLATIIDDEFHYRHGTPVGAGGVAAGVRALRAAFSEIACSIEQCVCEGEWGSFRFVITGIHTGAFAGHAPTGQRVSFSGADFVRFRGGKMLELWNVTEPLPRPAATR